MQRTWFTAKAIKPEHFKLPVNQVYIWLITDDLKVLIVSKDGNNYQLPGGKPEANESATETLKRELKEETNLDLAALKISPEFLGYYLISADANWLQFPKYLQLRFLLHTEKFANQFELLPNEANQLDGIKSIKFTELNAITQLIPWLKDLEEFQAVRKECSPVK